MTPASWINTVASPGTTRSHNAFGLVLFLAMLAALPMMGAILGQQEVPDQQPVLAGSGTCETCHAAIYDDWSDTIHGKMIQPATLETVQGETGSFVNRTGRKYWRAGRFYIEEDGVEYPVDYTLGNRRVQLYLSKASTGQINVLHSTWDIRREEWFHSSEFVLRAPENYRQVWNSTCMYCHVTQHRQDVKGFDSEAMTFSTEWVESSAGCERCHGPMLEHTPTSETDPIATDGSFEQLMVCGQCHWPKTVIATGFDARKPYLDYYMPMVASWDVDTTVDPDWWADGRPRHFSMEAPAFFLSGCFQSGEATCMSCHDPHWNRTDPNEQLMERADEFCVGCHTTGYDAEHTNHEEGSTGSSCVNCHMPYSISAVRHEMREHSMLGPEPVNTTRYDIPNACNDCHADRDAAWAVRYVEDWYPLRDRKLQRRATAFTLARSGHPDASKALLGLASDTRENPLIRAGAIGYLGVIPGDVPVDVVSAFATDPDPMIRIEAARALFGLASKRDVDIPPSLLTDPYRAVRVQGAVAMLGLAFSDRPLPVDETDPSFLRALKEYRDSLELEDDRVGIQVRLGNLDLFLGNLDAAAKAYATASRMDPGHLDALVGSAMVELGRGNRASAVGYLRRAVAASGGAAEYRNLLRMVAPAPLQ